MNFFKKEFHIIPSNKTSERIAGAILALMFVVVVPPFLFFSFVVPLFSSKTEQQTAHSPSAIELYVQAQGFVKQGLKAPSTAKFPLEPVSVGTDGNGLYQVESYVDSQNSFGAMIRSEWMLNMRPVGDKWMLETMQIDGKIVYDISTNE